MKNKLLTLCLALSLNCLPVVRAASVGGLQCESLRNPEGIDVAKPRLTWVMESRQRGARQTAWQVVAASSRRLLDAGQADLWDSGQVMSSYSVDVPYGGKPLGSLAGCFWKVRIWDQSGKPSGWSTPAHWSMGLLSPDDWKAKWIGLDETNATWNLLKGARWIWYPEGEPASSAPVGVRSFSRIFELPADRALSKAVFFWTADNEGTLIVNGTKIGVARDFHAATSFEVTRSLHPGTNAVVFVVRNTGDSPNPAGVIGALHLDFKSGEHEVVLTDGAWSASKTGGETIPLAEAVAAKVLGESGMGPWGAVKSGDSLRRLPARWLRKDFALAGEIRRATVCYSGLGWSELYVNGKRIGDEVMSPALSDYSKRVFYVTHDVTDNLRTGANAIGVILGNGRFYAPRLGEPAETRTFGFPKLLLQLHIEYKNGQTVDVNSDETWKLTTGGPIIANNEYDGEEYDANRELGEWARPGYDTKEWLPAQVVSAPGGVMAAPMLDPIRVTGTVKPVSLKEIQPGVWIYDFGQNFVGWCRVSVSGSKGQVLTLRHAERLTEDGSLYVDNLRGAKVTDIFTLKGRGLEVFEPRFTLHGFRYVELRGCAKAPTLDTLRGLIVNDDLATAGEFRCSNPMLNAILSNVVWGVRGNYRSIPTDCPQRDERQGWLGDRSAESRGEAYLFQHKQLYAKWVQDMADSQRPDGVVSDVCPNYWSFYNDGITWPASMTIIPWMLYNMTGDPAVIERQYPAISLWLNHHIALIQDGLSTRDTYGDWCVPPEDPKLIHSNDPARKTAGSLIATAYLYRCLYIGSRCAFTLGKTNEVAKFQQAAAVLKKGLNDHYYKKDVGYYDNGSATACILPLAFGMVPDGESSRVVDHLVQKIAQENNYHACFGLIGGQWVYGVLSRYGKNEVAYKLASQRTYPSLGYMVEQGATTIWELWNGNTADPAMNSGNHVMLVGDFVTWLYESLAGITTVPEGTAFRYTVMRPTPVGDLTFVSASHISPYGKIISNWKRTGGTFSWDVTIPANAQALLYVPAAEGARITESGKPTSQSNGLTWVCEADGSVLFEAVSGTYHFKVSAKN